jgi:hypothetical protein
MREWREDNGGFIRTIPRACGWTFGALFFPCLAEFVLLFAGRGAAFSRAWLPAATYSPLGFAWLWRRHV